MLISLRESLDAIRRLARGNLDKEFPYPEGKEFLLESKPSVFHYNIVVQPQAHTSVILVFLADGLVPTQEELGTRRI